MTVEDYAVRCHDCDILYAPLSEEAAVEIAAEHTEDKLHTDCHACRLDDLMPLIGYFEEADLGDTL